MTRIFLKNLFVLLILLAIAFAFYFPNLNNFFLSDDFDWLRVASSDEQSATNVFVTNNVGTKEGNSYRPMVGLVFYLAYNLWQLNPLGYHLISLVIFTLTAFLVFLIVKKICPRKIKWYVAFLAGLFFVVLPNHTEVVAWISCYPDLLATFFYLLSFYFYISFSEKKKAWSIILSILCFAFSILSKEIAISLPFVLIFYEFIRHSKAGFLERLKRTANRLGYIVLFFVIIILFIFARFYTTGYMFGYYGQANFIIDKFVIFKNLANSLVDMVIVGEWRVIANQVIFEYRWLFVAGCLLLAIGFPLLFKKIRKQILFLYTFFVLTILPVINLSMNPLNDEGERYLYLPSVVFCIFLSMILLSFWKKYWRFAFLVLIIDFLVFSSFFTVQKVQNWQKASGISQGIINDVGQLVELREQGQAVVFLALPELYEGAQVMRNALNYAIDFYYPNNNYKGYFLPIYTRLDRHNWNKDLIEWQKTDKGFYGKTVDDKFIVSGIATGINNDLYFELRGYDYEILMSNSIWLEVMLNFKKENKDEKVHWLSFDEGRLIRLFE